MKKFLLAILIPVLLLTGCSPLARKPETATLFAMDTVIDLSVYGDAALLDKIETLVTGLEDQLSVTKPDSQVYTINTTGSGVLTGHAAELMEGALVLCRRTGGALDLSIYPVVRAWGFTTGDYRVPSDDEIRDLLTRVDYTKIQYDPATGTVNLPANMEIDFGSVGKGYAAGLAAQLLRDRGVQSALLNFGGNVQTVGRKPDGSPWQIAVKDPQTGTPMMALSIEDQAVVTSGGYERYFEQDGQTYWHIMDPSTGCPADSGLLSVTVVGSDGLLCDGLSTSLFIMGLERAADFWGQSDDFEAIFITTDGTVYITEGLKDRFALLADYADTTVRLIER